MFSQIWPPFSKPITLALFFKFVPKDDRLEDQIRSQVWSGGTKSAGTSATGMCYTS